MKRLTIICVLCLVSCSVSSDPTSTPVTETPQINRSLPRENEDTPYVYEHLDPSTPFPPGYVTALKDCGNGEKVSLPATSRQLFVGLSDLTIRKLGDMKVQDNDGFLTIADGSLDGTPLYLAVLSRRDGECVVDVVLWRRTKDGEVISPEIIAADTDTLLQYTTNL